MSRKALITGSSRGIGRAIAISLARDGCEVYIQYATGHEKAEEVRRLLKEEKLPVHIVQGDLTDTASVKKILEQTGEVDILVLNASIQIRNKWEQITVEQYEKQMTCNFLSSLLLMQGTVPYMRRNQWGRIITIGSVQERKPHPDMLIYSASKAAQTNMVTSLALQLAPDGITVNNIAPGVITTDRNKAALSDAGYTQKVRESIPAGFFGRPEDCCGIVRLLCSDEGRYITGQNIFVDGGKGIR